METRTRRTRAAGYFHVHYSPVPGATKKHFSAIQPQVTERLQEMTRRGQLVVAGNYPSSLGGMWLIKAKNRNEAERLVGDNPAVKCSLVVYKLTELMDPIGTLAHQDAAAAVAAETAPQE